MPIVAETTSAIMAAMSEVRVAKSNRDQMSWPEPSAPSQ